MTDSATLRKFMGWGISLLALLVLAPGAWAQQPTKVVTDDITTNTTWSSDTTYVLNGLVFVGESTVTVDQNGNVTGTQNLADDADDPTLTIEPGTVIKARASEDVTATGDQQQEGASALIVRRSGKIDAEGTPEDPITFTAEADDLDDPFDLNDGDGPGRRLWGGVILLGEASTNQTDANGRIHNNQIEGVPATNNTAMFGGGSASNVNDMDDTGTFRYVSIRHAGFSISGVQGDEINGLTMGAIGRGTTIDHVEVYANFDDGFEWFGGTVHTSHLLAAYCGDDAFDYDQGYRGTGQFWATIQDDDRAGRGGEHDGNDAGAFDDAPFTSRPVITNATYIGAGQNATNVGGDGSNNALQIRDNAGGEYYNSVFTDFPQMAASINTGDGTDAQVDQGNLMFENNAFFGFGAGATFDALVNTASDQFANGFTNVSGEFSGNLVGSEVAVRSTDRNQQDTENALDPRPTQAIAGQSTTAKGSFVANAAADVGSGLSVDEYLNPIDDVSYHGAVNPNAALSPNASDRERIWMTGWTATFQNQILLPVELAGFSVQKDDSDYVLTWRTASEKNNAGFDIQRSVDEKPFRKIGSREGAGTTEQVQTYRFTDSQVPFQASSIRYRLRQKDFDGTVEIGPVRTIDVGTPEQAKLLAPFPNPTPQQATIRYQLPEDGKVQLSVYNILGQRVSTLVNSQQTAGNKERRFDTSTLSSGVYFIRLQAQGKTHTERLTVVK